MNVHAHMRQERCPSACSLWERVNVRLGGKISRLRLYLLLILQT